MTAVSPRASYSSHTGRTAWKNHSHPEAGSPLAACRRATSMIWSWRITSPPITRKRGGGATASERGAGTSAVSQGASAPPPPASASPLPPASPAAGASATASPCAFRPPPHPAQRRAAARQAHAQRSAEEECRRPKSEDRHPPDPPRGGKRLSSIGAGPDRWATVRGDITSRRISASGERWRWTRDGWS